MWLELKRERHGGSNEFADGDDGRVCSLAIVFKEFGLMLSIYYMPGTLGIDNITIKKIDFASWIF